MDFPGQPQVPPIVSTYSVYAPAGRGRQALGGTIAAGSIAWPAANRAIYVPMTLPGPCVVRRLFWTNGSTVTGSSEVGVYTRGGVRLCSTGLTAQSGASVLQFVTLGTPVYLDAGVYYLATQNDGTTNRMFGTVTPTVNQGRLAGLLQQDLGGGGVLPATMTPATLTAFAYPLAGIVQNTATPH